MILFRMGKNFSRLLKRFDNPGKALMGKAVELQTNLKSKAIDRLSCNRFAFKLRNNKGKC